MNFKINSLPNLTSFIVLSEKKSDKRNLITINLMNMNKNHMTTLQHELCNEQE